MNKIINIVLCITLIAGALSSQEITQKIKGKVFDIETEETLPFVNIIVKDSDPIIGTSTDLDGNFVLPNVSLGRIDLQISYVGYQTIIIPEVVITSAKEVILDIGIEPTFNELEEITIKPKILKQKPLNKMATVSARMLSVEEASRYAGGFDDPARLASAFPGVASSVGNNAIVIRGNAPKFLQWKIEGIEIPNPNHFADLGAFGGGGLTALSSNLLANSDFLTGAFPAEYNNAISGVFDIKMRNGSSSKHEHSIEVGLIGVDFASEGPLSNTGNSSYLFNYRYSTLGLMAPLLPEDADGTTYQDLSFKFNFPSLKSGIFSFWGIGLKDNSGTQLETDPDLRNYYQDIEDQDVKQYMGATGINHKYFFKNSAYLNTSLAFSANGVDLETSRLDDVSETLKPENHTSNSNYNITFKSFFNKRYSSKHVNRTGITFRGLGFDMNSGESNNGENIKDIVSEKGFTTLLSAFSNSTLTTDKWIFNFGLTTQLFTLNDSYSIEPRLGMKFMFDETNSISFAYGLHSRIEPLHIYFANTTGGIESLGNKNLGFTKAHHLVLAYDVDITEKLHLKVEPYFQLLKDVPIKESSNESLLNLQNDWFITDTYVNTGMGHNYGLDVTLEQYMSNGLYYLLSGSIFNSEYKTENSEWFNTRFNKNYLFNGLIGKEFKVGDHKQNSFNLNLRISVQGGDRYSRIDDDSSLSHEDVIYNEVSPYTEQTSPSTILHTTISYQWNKRRTTQKISLKILNATSFEEFLGHRYNFKSGKVEEHREALIIPNLSYKISF